MLGYCKCRATASSGNDGGDGGGYTVIHTIIDVHLSALMCCANVL